MGDDRISATAEAAAGRSWSALIELLRRPEVHDSVDDAVRALDLPGPGLLRAFLGLTDPAPMSALKNAMQCDASYVTSVVDVLEDRGFVERRPSSADRRVKLVALTDEGREAQQTARDCLGRPPAVVYDLPEDDLVHLADVLERLVAAFVADSDGRRQGGDV